MVRTSPDPARPELTTRHQRVADRGVTRRACSSWGDSSCSVPAFLRRADR